MMLQYLEPMLNALSYMVGTQTFPAKEITVHGIRVAHLK